jgi:hypothetical protein
LKLMERKRPEQSVYFDTVRRALRDVPRPMRDELLADLRTRLDELPSDASITEALGSAQEYARLARDAAGCAPPTYGRVARMRAWPLGRKLVIVAAVALLVVTTAAAILRAHYQPLAVDTIGGSSTAEVIVSNVPTDAQYYRYQPGATVVVTAELRNRGRTTATVTGVSVPNGFGPFRVSELRFTRNEYDVGVWQRGTPARRFSVHPGETVYAFVVMKIVTQTIGVGDSESEALPSLRVEVLGVDHIVAIAGRAIGVLSES